MKKGCRGSPFREKRLPGQPFSRRAYCSPMTETVMVAVTSVCSATLSG
jgi:hypothetical protein